MKKILFITVLFLIFSITFSSFAQINYITVLSFGNYGNREGEFNYPVCITIDKDDNLFVSDWDNDRIQKFTSDGRFLKSFPDEKSDFTLDGPVGIVMDSQDNMIVVEQFNHRIHKISPDGKSIKMTGSEGNGSGEFSNPRGIAIDENDNLYVVDTGNSRVQVFSPDLEFIMTFGKEGMGNGEFYYPRGIALDKDANLYIADTFHNQIQVLTKDGLFLRKFGVGGNEIGQFDGTRYLTFDSENNLYVSDYKNAKIVKFDKNDQFVVEFGNEEDRANLSYPEGIAIDSRDYIYIADAGNNRIVKYCVSQIVIHSQLADKYAGENNWESAAEEYKKVIEIDPLNIDARKGIAVAYFEANQWENAINAYIYLQKIYPEEQKYALKIIDAKYNLAVDDEKNSLFSSASAGYKKVLALNPNYPEAKKRYYISFIKSLYYSLYVRIIAIILVFIVLFIIIIPGIKKRKKTGRHSRRSRF